MRLMVIGAGAMGRQHAANFSAMGGIDVVAAVDVRAELLAKFCEEHGIPNSFPTLEEALGWNGFDAACVVTPDDSHKPAALPLLAAGKHVLCEKPLAPNYPDAAEMAEAAGSAGTVAMVNFTYRGVKEMIKARQIVDSGAIGEVRHVEASYLQSWLAQDAWGRWDEEPTWLWRLSSKHGSLGVLGDIGVHLLDFIGHGSGQGIAKLDCRLRAFDKAPGDRIGEYELDANDSAVMQLELANGALGVAHMSRWASGHHNDLRLRIFGDKGGIELDSVSQPRGSTMRVCIGEDNLRTASWETIEAPEVPTSMELFADALLRGGEREPSFAHAARMQKLLDEAFASAASSD